MIPLYPLFSVCADSEGVAGALPGSADSNGVTGGRLRSKDGETRCLSVCADSKGDREEGVKDAKELEEVEERAIAGFAGKPP